MPNKWTVKLTGDNMDVYVRRVLSDSERHAHLEVFKERGFTKEMAKVAIEAMNNQEPMKCNDEPTKAHAGRLFHYIVTYATPGDVICYNDNVYVMLELANA